MINKITQSYQQKMITKGIVVTTPDSESSQLYHSFNQNKKFFFKIIINFFRSNKLNNTYV